MSSMMKSIPPCQSSIIAVSTNHYIIVKTKTCSVNKYGKIARIETEFRILNGRMLGDLRGKLTFH